MVWCGEETMLISSVKMLGTAINGAVSSPVSGGVPLYRETFIESSFRSYHPEYAIEVQVLQDALDEYAECVHRALKVHGKLCKDIAFHEALKSRTSHPLRLIYSHPVASDLKIQGRAGICTACPAATQYIRR